MYSLLVLKLRSYLAIWSMLAGVYVLALLLGLGYIHLPSLRRTRKTMVWSAWSPPDPDTISAGPASDSIHYGMQLFNNTPWYAPQYTGSKLTCSDCHIEGGIAPHAIPMVRLPRLFPMYSKRARRFISLRDRIQDCFTRSENGRPLPYDSREMNALVAYIQWLSQPEPTRKPYSGRGLIGLPPLQPDPKHGAQIYAAQCAGCHGEDGAGSLPLMPPLWGPDSFNDGAGMSHISKMAPFVQYNMPQNRRGILSAQDAYDASAYIETKPRPAFNPAYKKY